MVMRIVSIVLLVVVVVMAALLCRSFESEEVDTFALKQGSSGQQVRQIQSKLSAWGYYSGEVDGIYGSKTTEAVKNFQRVNGLKVDGIVGEETAAKIGIALTQSSS